jgi:hypothetical protein
MGRRRNKLQQQAKGLLVHGKCTKSFVAKLRAFLDNRIVIAKLRGYGANKVAMIDHSLVDTQTQMALGDCWRMCHTLLLPTWAVHRGSISLALYARSLPTELWDP